jgi:hypothetical protein
MELDPGQRRESSRVTDEKLFECFETINLIDPRKNKGAFVSDLKEKENELIYFSNYLMNYKSSPKRELAAYHSTGLYVNVEVKEYVLGIDSFSYLRNEDEMAQRRMKNEYILVLNRIANNWYARTKSEAAQVIRNEGKEAPKERHLELFQELFPKLKLVFLMSLLPPVSRRNPSIDLGN